MGAGRIAVRALVAYGMALLLTRLSGKRVIGQATPFDLTISVVIGDLFDDLLWAEIAATQFLAAIGSIFLAAGAIEVACRKSSRMYDLVNGPPRIILRDGSEDRREMRREQLSVADVWHLLRMNGVGKDGRAEVRLGVVEHDHHLSVLRHPWAEKLRRKDAALLGRGRGT